MASPSLERLCKWRMVLAGWVFGTRLMNDPGTKGARDLMDKQLIYRVELSALAALLIKKGIFTAEEFMRQMDVEGEILQTAHERMFPGFKATADGMHIFDVQIAQKTMSEKGFPP